MSRKFTDLSSLSQSGYYTNEWGDPLAFFTGAGFPEITEDTSLRTGTPVLSIYYDGDSPNISLSSGTQLDLVHDGNTVSFELSGKTTSQVVALINRNSYPYNANVMVEVDDVGTSVPFTNASDLTLDGGQVLRVAGHLVKPLESSQIRILPPYNDSRYDPWYIIVNQGWVTRQFNGGDWIFTIPEYRQQTWSTKYGFGFIDVQDIIAERIGPRALRVPRSPIHWDRNNLTIKVRDVTQNTSVVKDVDVYNGIIYLNRDYDDNETILVDYTYKEDGFIYSDVDLNPTEFHSPGALGRYILFYLLPYSGPDGVLRNTCVRYSESSTLAGALQSIPYQGEPIMLLGAVQIRQVNDVSEVQVVDTRTRGGGVKWSNWEEAKKRNREILSTADRGFFDGRPYPGNMSLIVTLPSEIKDSLQKPEINGIIKRFMAYGTYTFIEFD